MILNALRAAMQAGPGTGDSAFGISPAARDAVLTLATRVSMIGTGVVTAIVTARVLGPAGRGLYFYITTLALLASQFGNVGLSTSNARASAQRPEDLGALAANTLWASLGLGWAAAGAMTIFHIISGNQGTLGAVANLAVLVPGMIYGLLASNLLLGLSRVTGFNAYLLLSSFLQLAAVAVSAFVTRDVFWVLWCNALAVLASSAGLGWYLSRLGARHGRPDLRLLLGSMAFAGRVYLTTLLGFLVGRLNVILLTSLSGPTELGYYSIAQQFTDAILLLPGSIAIILFPRLVKSEAGTSFAKTLRTALMCAACLLPPCIILALTAPVLIPLMFGAAYAPAAPVLIWLLPGAFALGVASIFSQFLAASGVPLANIGVWAVALVGLLAGSLVAIPMFGALGAAAALSTVHVLLAAALIGLAVASRHP